VAPEGAAVDLGQALPHKVCGVIGHAADGGDEVEAEVQDGQMQQLLLDQIQAVEHPAGKDRQPWSSGNR
jgi:hypothetical protein